ncbi:MAG: hypothetical protein R3C32_03195 [Chloroflexota bacterium]
MGARGRAAGIIAAGIIAAGVRGWTRLILLEPGMPQAASPAAHEARRGRPPTWVG